MHVTAPEKTGVTCEVGLCRLFYVSWRPIFRATLDFVAQAGIEKQASVVSYRTTTSTAMLGGEITSRKDCATHPRLFC